MAISSKNVKPIPFRGFKPGRYEVVLHEAKAFQAKSKSWGINVEFRFADRTDVEATRIHGDALWITTAAFPHVLGFVQDCTGKSEFPVFEGAESSVAKKVAEYLNGNKKPFMALLDLQDWVNEETGDSGKKIILRNAV